MDTWAARFVANRRSNPVSWRAAWSRRQPRRQWRLATHLHFQIIHNLGNTMMTTPVSAARRRPRVSTQLPDPNLILNLNTPATWITWLIVY